MVGVWLDWMPPDGCRKRTQPEAIGSRHIVWGYSRFTWQAPRQGVTNEYHESRHLRVGRGVAICLRRECVDGGTDIQSGADRVCGCHDSCAHCSATHEESLAHCRPNKHSGKHWAPWVGFLSSAIPNLVHPSTSSSMLTDRTNNLSDRESNMRLGRFHQTNRC